MVAGLPSYVIYALLDNPCYNSSASVVRSIAGLALQSDSRAASQKRGSSVTYSDPPKDRRGSAANIPDLDTLPVPSVSRPAVTVSDLDTMPVASVSAAPATVSRARAPLSRQVIGLAALMWLATRIAYLVITYFPVNHLGANLETTGNRLALWSRFDANWYISIAQHGYGPRASFAFYPLYPLLIHGLGFLVGPAHSLQAAMLISNAGSLLAFIGLGLLAAHDAGDSAAAPRAIRAMAVYPFAFFMFAPYTEGLFLGFAVLSVLCARRGSWKWAAFWAFLAGATRPTGAILIPALFFEFGSQQGWWRRDYWRSGRWRNLFHLKPISDFILAMAAVPLAIGLFMFYSAQRIGNPLEPFYAQNIAWGRTSQPIWQTLAELLRGLASAPIGGRVQSLILIDLGAVTLCALITLLAIRKIPFAYVVYMAGLLYISVATPILTSPSIIDSAARFMVAAFPVWLVLGRWFAKRPWLDMAVVFIGLSLQIIFALLFMSGFGIQ